MKLNLSEPITEEITQEFISTVNSKLIRSVYTDNPIIERREYREPTRCFKPIGMWYSLNNEWREWVLDNMPEWERKYNHPISIDESKLLIINTFEELELFINQYKMDEYCIDWSKLYTKYMGIEWRNYGNIRHKTFSSKLNMIYSFYWGLDCSSGCIWNMDCVKL